MAAAEELMFSLRAMINKEKTKVLFAEVDSAFADVLLSFLTLPLGTIVRLLLKHYGDDRAPVFGSLTTLYNSLADLDNVHFWTEAGKLMLLNPRSCFQDECSKLKLNIDNTEPTKYFTCEDWDCRFGRYLNINMYHGTAKCSSCCQTINREIDVTMSYTEAADGYGIFTLKTVSFLISDDLRMVPNVAGSFIQTLSNLGIWDTDGAKQITVTVGLNDIMDLLKGSLFSGTPLTDLILHKEQKTDSAVIESEPGVLVDQIEKKEISETEEKMILKVMVQKSTNRFLFAQANEDFVDFLFSFFTIPLAGVQCLLGSNSCLKNIDNLHRSSANLNKCLKTQATKSNLFNPQLPPMYRSKNLILPLSEQKSPALYYTLDYGRGRENLTPYRASKSSKLARINDPKGQGSYVRGPTMYTVTDNLTVTPLCMSTNLSMLGGEKIQLSDVKELQFEIGLEEALSILKASLTSTCALSNGLSSIIKIQPKQETSA